MARRRAFPVLEQMSGKAGQDVVISFLSQPDAYGGGVEDVTVIQTHASVVFLAGDRAYKLKRAIRYSYLDYSTPALRRQACETELDLNRRTAPEIYLHVSPIIRSADGALHIDGNSRTGEAIDWVVVMRRFSQNVLLSHLADDGKLSLSHVLALTSRVAAFHEDAPENHVYGGADGISAVIRINDENLRRSMPPGVSTRDIDQLRDCSLVLLEKYRKLLDQRRDAGRVRQCHGDLHLGNVCLWNGQPTLFDCIEFSRSISCIDVLYDLAFLLMDLRYRGLREFCGRVFNRYLDLGGDDDGLPLLPFFMSLRASVRAHVSSAAAAQERFSANRETRLAEARRYFDLALQLLAPAPAWVIAIGGLSGSGKSQVAAALAGELGTAPGARVLRSDVLRKRHFGVGPECRLPESAYTDASSREVYATIIRLAGAALDAGHSVIIDAVAAKAAERDSFSVLAGSHGAGFRGIWLDVPEDILLERVARRGPDASDATAEVVKLQMRYDIGPMNWERVNAGGTLDSVVASVRRSLGAGQKENIPGQPS